MLRTIPGIGARTAREIISYRERLGGFTDMGQLLEIRIIDSARWRQITPYLSIDTTGALHKLRINHASVNELVKHPYIDYYLAKTIVVWRDNKGRFRSLDEMRSATRVYPELYNRLKPYLTTQ
jgi:DNA uptake protein ComE-like DNA-binding protein